MNKLVSVLGALLATILMAPSAKASLLCSSGAECSSLTTRIEARMHELSSPIVEFSDVPTDRNGGFLQIPFEQARDYCSVRGWRLPAPREMIALATLHGSRGIRETAYYGEPLNWQVMNEAAQMQRAGYTWFRRENGASQTSVEFYYTTHGYRRPTGPLGENAFWASHGYFDGRDGSLEHVALSNAVICVKAELPGGVCDSLESCRALLRRVKLRSQTFAPPSELDEPVRRNGAVWITPFYRTSNECSRLPTIRDFAHAAHKLGARGIRETEHPGVPLQDPALVEESSRMLADGFETITLLMRVDGKNVPTVGFYYSSEGYQRPHDDLGNHDFWTFAATADAWIDRDGPTLSAMGYVLDGRTGKFKPLVTGQTSSPLAEAATRCPL